MSILRLALDITSVLSYMAGCCMGDMQIDGELDPSRALTSSEEQECSDEGASIGNEEECSHRGVGGQAFTVSHC